MTQPDYPKNTPHDRYWYAKCDEQFGWCVVMKNAAPSTVETGEWVAGFMTEFSAKYITRLHNQTLHERKQREDPEHDRSSCYCCCFDCPDDLDE